MVIVGGYHPTAVHAGGVRPPGGVGHAGRIYCGVPARLLSGLPQWLLDLEPFAHILRVGGGSFSRAPRLWLLAIDAALVALGVAASRPPTCAVSLRYPTDGKEDP
jgi:hypothetical protein